MSCYCEHVAGFRKTSIDQDLNNAMVSTLVKDVVLADNRISVLGAADAMVEKYTKSYESDMLGI